VTRHVSTVALRSGGAPPHLCKATSPANGTAGALVGRVLGETIGNYRLTGKLSEGGMGIVYRAEHALLGRAAAIKLILPVWSEDRDIVQRFFNEARVTSSMRHPGIVEIFDFGYHTDGRAYLVMELLAGEPLSHRLAKVGRLEAHVAVRVARSVAGALAAAHARGVIHRDLKPDNVFLVPDADVAGGERPKLLDFGIAKLADARSSAGQTRTGLVMGTPAYMSPEQCRGSGEIDARADLYSLGCILYELLGGRPPFVAEGSGELIGAQLFVAPDPLRAHLPSVDPTLESLVMRLLEKDPARRPPGALDVVAELTSIAADLPAPSGWKVLAPTTLGAAAGATTTPPVAARQGRWRIAAAAIVASAVAAGILAASAERGPSAPPPAEGKAAAAPLPSPPPPPSPPPLPPPPPPAVPDPPPKPHAKRRPKPPRRDSRSPIDPFTESTPPAGPLVDTLPPPVGPLVDDLPAPRKPTR
jgi:serine/threonine-protein kinase